MAPNGAQWLPPRELTPLPLPQAEATNWLRTEVQAEAEKLRNEAEAVLAHGQATAAAAQVKCLES